SRLPRRALQPAPAPTVRVEAVPSCTRVRLCPSWKKRHRQVLVTRPSDDHFVDGDGCAAVGTLAARGRRGFEARRAWRRLVEMYMSADRPEGLRGMVALATTFGFTPSLVGRLVLFRVRRELRSAAMGTRR